MAEKIVLEGIVVKPGDERGRFVAELRSQMMERVADLVARCLCSALDQEVDDLLGRDPYEREGSGSEVEVEAYCLKCKSRRRGDIRRDGHRKRQLVMGAFGKIDVWMPRLECARCQGTVHMSYQTIRPRQRLWDDVEEEMRGAYGLGQSLREITAELSERWGTSVGLRSVNERVHKMARIAGEWQEREWTSCPPVVMLDAIWITVMRVTDRVRVDALGRQRRVKEGYRAPVLVALGVWPQERRKVVLGWELGDGPGEDAGSWLRLVTRLEAHGVNGAHGLRLVVHDGGSGLRQALDEVYLGAPHQRCVFHKLRNIADDIILPEEMNRVQARRLKRRILKEASAIWQAKHQETARRRLTRFSQSWTESQPKMVATAQRDFEDTTAFYDVLDAARKRGESWAPTLLRTTSLLERTNRTYRRRLRLAVAIHSLTGLEAMLAQQAARIELPYYWPSRVNKLVAQWT